jgi:hypothetical protein
MSDNRSSSGKKTTGVIKVAKWCFGIYITLVLIGILLIFIGVEDPGPRPKEGPFAGILAMFGDIQFDWPEQGMELLGAGMIALMAGIVAALLASVTALISLLKSSWSVWATIILLLSLPYVCGAILLVANNP